jgi:hypothetical protein
VNEIVPYAYAATGQVIVLADGPELLVYSGANDQGMWKVMCTDILMGVGYTKTHVHAIDGAGLLCTYRLIDGLEQGRIETGASPWGLVVSELGADAIITAGSLVLVRPGGAAETFPLASPRCAAFGAGGSRLAVGGAGGALSVIDVATGAVVGAGAFPAAIKGVAWRATGQWVVGHGNQLDFVDPESLAVQKSVLVDAPIVRFAISEDGAIAAVQVAESLVRLFELASDTTVGEVEFQRPLFGLAFGPATWLGFGFDDGDANRLDVLTGKMTRTQAHPGRAQNAWAMNVRVNHAQVRGVVVGMAAGGSAIARHNVPKIPKKRKKWFWWVVGGAIAFVLLTGCCGLAGGLGLFAYW